MKLGQKIQQHFHNRQVGGGSVLPSLPDYATLDDFIAIYDSTGLVAGEDNDYGHVNTSNNITTSGWKSLAPGPTGVDMVQVNVVGLNNISIQMRGSVPVLELNGQARFRNTAGTNEFNPLHYNATFTDLKWEQYILFRPGFGSTPGYRSGIFGNNGAGSQANKGVNCAYDNRETVPRTHAMINNMTKGTAGFISTQTDNDIFTPNTWQILTLRFDGSQTAANRLKAWIDGVSVSITVTSDSTAVVTGPTYDFELGAEGNGLFPMRGQISHAIFRTGLTEDSVRETFENSLIAWKNYFNSKPDTSDRLRVYNIYDINRYHLSLHKCVKGDTERQIFTDGSSHTATTARKVVMRRSSDRGVTYSAAEDVYDPADPSGVRDIQAGYTSTGRLLIAVSHGETAISLALLKSDDDGDNFTEVDLSSLIPSDTLNSFRVYGDGIKENNGRIGFGIYKFTDEGPDTTESANYFFYSDDDGDNWSVSTIRAVGTTYINESAWIGLGGDNLLAIIRNEATKEWQAYPSTTNGTSWGSGVAVTMGETMPVAVPGQLRKFTIEGVTVVAFYYIMKSGDVNGPLKSIYSTPARLLVDPTDWDTGTTTELAHALLHYGSIDHYDGGLAARASYCRETSGALGDNEVWSMYLPTNHEATIKTALGI